MRTKEEKAAYNKKYREEHKAERNIKNKKYREEHKEDLILYRENRKEFRKIYMAKYQEEHKEDLAEKRKIYYNNNLDLFEGRSKIYYNNNLDLAREYNRNYKKQRRKNNPVYSIEHNLRKRLWEAVKSQRATKSAHTIELIGCSIEELMVHLESQFQEGMTFENYGRWHVDHIRPCASFNLLLEEEQRACFHYSNLQPLWAEDNLKKGDRWEFAA